MIAVPSGPARDIDIEGVSDERLTSLRRQRHALGGQVRGGVRPSRSGATRGQNALSESEGVLGSTWPQQHGVLSALVPAGAVRRLRGHRPRHPHPRGARPGRRAVRRRRRPRRCETWTRLWGTDPWTQGYVTNWRPGDVEAVGPLHGTHEPPFYVCGSDQWVAGYMEGAVRTGRGAAAAALAQVTRRATAWTSA